MGQGCAQTEAHQGQQCRIALAARQEVMETFPVQIADMDAEFAAAVADAVPQYQRAAQLTVGPAQPVLLFHVDLHPAFDAFLDRSEERRVGKECISRWSAYD